MLPGGGGGGGVSWALSGDNTNPSPSGFRAEHGFLGCPMLGEMLRPDSLLPPDRICWKNSGSDNEVDPVDR